MRLTVGGFTEGRAETQVGRVPLFPLVEVAGQDGLSKVLCLSLGGGHLLLQCMQGLIASSDLKVEHRKSYDEDGGNQEKRGDHWTDGGGGGGGSLGMIDPSLATLARMPSTPSLESPGGAGGSGWR